MAKKTTAKKTKTEKLIEEFKTSMDGTEIRARKLSERYEKLETEMKALDEKIYSIKKALEELLDERELINNVLGNAANILDPV